MKRHGRAGSASATRKRRNFATTTKKSNNLQSPLEHCLDLRHLLATVLNICLEVFRGSLLRNEDDGCRALCEGCGAEAALAGDVDVGDVCLLTEKGDMSGNLDGKDVAGDEDEALLALAEGEDDLLDAAAERLVLRGGLDKFVRALREGGGGHWLRDGRHEGVYVLDEGDVADCGRGGRGGGGGGGSGGLGRLLRLLRRLLLTQFHIAARVGFSGRVSSLALFVGAHDDVLRMGIRTQVLDQGRRLDLGGGGRRQLA